MPQSLPAVLLDIAKSARAKPEIWENYSYTAEYMKAHATIDDDGYLTCRPQLHMAREYYLHWLENIGRVEDLYFFMAGDRLEWLMLKWASGEIAPDDDSRSLAFLSAQGVAGNEHGS